MGKAMGLNPAIILLSLSIWGTILGFIGLIIALPLTTLCLSYYKRFILHEDNELDPGNLAHQPKREKINSDLSAKNSHAYCILKKYSYLCTRITEVTHRMIR